MKIETSIKPRRDGSLTIKISDRSYPFAFDDSGALVSEVENENDIAYLLSNGDSFMPADEADFALADALVNSASVSDDLDNEKFDDDEGDERSDPNAAPIEEPASAVAAKVAPRAAKIKAK